MDNSNRRNSSVLKSLDRMCEQLIGGDKSVAETMIDYMQLTDFAEGEEDLANMTIEKAFKKLSNQKIVTIQQNLGIYSATASEETKNFYMWLNARLEKVRLEEWTYEKFFESWYNALNGITKKAKSKDTLPMDRIGIINIIMMVNELKEK